MTGTPADDANITRCRRMLSTICALDSMPISSGAFVGQYITASVPFSFRIAHSRRQILSSCVCCIGMINNADALVDEYCEKTGHQFMAMSNTKVNMVELLAALINQKQTLVDGIRYAQSKIDGSATILMMTDSKLIAARDPIGIRPLYYGNGRRCGAVVPRRRQNEDLHLPLDLLRLSQCLL